MRDNRAAVPSSSRERFVTRDPRARGSEKGGIRATSGSADPAGHCLPSSRSPHRPARQHPEGTHLRRLGGRHQLAAPQHCHGRPAGLRRGEEAALQPEPGPRSAPARPPADPGSSGRRLTRRPSPARAPARLHPPNQEVNRRRKCLPGRRGQGPRPPEAAVLSQLEGAVGEKGTGERGVSVRREFWKRTLILPDPQGAMGKVVRRRLAAGLQLPACPWRSQQGVCGGLLRHEDSPPDADFT
ncbi:uncharacterized protein [Vicugna pacos]|uniref:Uncharacterized protein n=1 Tax=Vicugna pacos TaxID=30538 RepID=A0ABM5BDL1_VICPA